MKHYKHSNMKPTICFSTSPALAGLNMGRLALRKHKNLKKVVKQYRNKDGKRCFAGTALLKETQTLVLNCTISYGQNSFYEPSSPQDRYDKLCINGSTYGMFHIVRSSGHSLH